MQETAMSRLYEKGGRERERERERERNEKTRK
jgi:hypothetical protein